MNVDVNHSRFAAPTRTVAVLLGGGIESTLLVRRYLDSEYQVLPVHIHCGLIWDDVETEYCRRFCRQLAQAQPAAPGGNPPVPEGNAG